MIMNKITRQTISLDVKKGQPPEDAVRMAVVQLFIGIARAIEQYDGKKGSSFFPVAFPLRMSMVSEQVHWDFTIHMKVENIFSDDAEDE